jgi:short-subunit dehydrogenase
MTNTSFSQKPVAVITGAAGGIGRAIAVCLASKGYCTALADINETGLQNLRKELGHEHHTFVADITDPAQVENMIAEVIARTGRIDVLVNNAGMVITQPFADCSIADLCRENGLNYMGALYCTKGVLPHMRKAGKGIIVSIASLAGILPLAVSPGYTASKFALRGLMLSLHMALKPYGIHVGCVCPSAVDTPMLFHEATSGGSALNFLQEPLAPEAVAEAVWQMIKKRKMEVCVPGHEGISCKLGGFFPAILPRILPWLERIGERNRMRYIQKKEPLYHGIERRTG